MSYLLRRPSLAASGLVFGAILVGVLYYAQAGLLLSPSVVSHDHSLTAESDTPQDHPASSEQPIDEVLDTQETIIAPTPSAKPKTPKPSKVQGMNCDEKMRKATLLNYKKSLDAENERHKKRMSEIGGHSKLLSMLSFGKLDDKIRAENLRHRQAISAIIEKYNTALAATHCR